MSTDVQDRLVDRFLRYSAITSASDASATTVPTTAGQRELAELLADELRAMGAADVHLSDTSVLTARIPSTLPPGHPPVPRVGFCAHLDVVDVDLDNQVRPQVVKHTGGDVLLNHELDLWIRRDEHPELDRYVGDRLLVTDGTSVLGADDKAALASIMEAAAVLLHHPEPHGEVYLAFVPDEEIGLRGVRTMDLARFPVDFAWTIDCCAIGELVTQTFNAAQCTVHITGVAAHPMSAKDVLVNPILVAHDLVARFDRLQTPEHTEGDQGYLWVHGIRGNQSTAQVDINIRDHDRHGYAARKQQLVDAVQATREQHPRATLELTMDDVYGNIADAFTPDTMAAVDCLRQAFATLGITPVEAPMRGGTDGSWLSQQGIPTPNFFTGAHNFHSVAEFLPLGSFEASHRVVLELIRAQV